MLNGTQGLAVAQDFSPDVILLDIGLPDLDGYQVANLLRQQLAKSSTLLIALSDYAPKDDALMLNTAFDHYLIKPLKFNELSNLICTCLRKQTEEQARQLPHSLP